MMQEGAAVMKKYLGDRPDLARKLVQFRALKAMLKYKVRATLSPPPPPPRTRARGRPIGAPAEQELCLDQDDTKHGAVGVKADLKAIAQGAWTKGKSIVHKYLKPSASPPLPEHKCHTCDSPTQGKGVRTSTSSGKSWQCLSCFMNTKRSRHPHKRCKRCRKKKHVTYYFSNERYCGDCIKHVVIHEREGKCTDCSTACVSYHSVRALHSDGGALRCRPCWDKRNVAPFGPEITSEGAIAYIDQFCLPSMYSDPRKRTADTFLLDIRRERSMAIFDAHIGSLKSHLKPIFADFKKSSEWRELKLSTTDADADLPEEMLGGGATAGGAEAEQPAAEQETAMASDSFADYVPAKLTYGPPHIEHVVESASLACVSPTDITYTTLLPAEVLSSGVLSRVQLEAVIYVLQQHEKMLPSRVRAGFFIGDGTGVGKGRELAAIIWENWLRGRRRAVWFTCNTDLTVDARRDLDDIGARHIGLQSLTALSYDPIAESFDEGVLLVTYSCLVAKQGKAKATERSRVEQLQEWLDGRRFDGVLAFDEAHKAKGAAHNQPVGKTVVELQAALPLARVVYLSATGATHVQDMSYMTRLGLWGPGTYFSTFPAIEQARRDRVEMRPRSAP